MDFGVITFTSTHAAIRTQKHLERHMKVTMMPTLREISQGCGISLRFALTELKNVQRRMADFDLDPKMFAIYRIRMEQGKYQAEQVDTVRRDI
jgi:hypothetical protein